MYYPLILNVFKKAASVAFVIMLALSIKSTAQESLTISGAVKDELGNPLVGVTVHIKGKTQGTITNAQGQFHLSASPSDSLIFSYVGYQPSTIAVDHQTNMNVTLQAAVGSLNEVVVVGYGEQKKATVTGAISSIKTKEIKQSPAANLAVTLAGRLPGLIVQQTSGEPGRDVTNLYLRGIGTINGKAPLILVDGIPRDLTYIDPNEVESITILKDASATAVYGVRGANGVILVTTKRGKNEKPQIDFSAEYGIQGFTRLPSYVRGYQYVLLRNQAAENDGLGAYYFYSPSVIEHYKLGDDPLRYPDVDWPKILMHKFTPQNRYDLNLTGGGEYVRYFVNAGYLHQGGLWKVDQKAYDPSSHMDRYNFRSNIDLYLTRDKSLRAFMNLAGYLEKINAPSIRAISGLPPSYINYLIFSFVYSTPPTQGGPLTPFGQVESSGKYYSAYGAINRSGYNQETLSNVTSSFGFDQDLGFITKGLSAQIMMSFDTRSDYDLDAYQSYEQWKEVVDTTLKGADGKDSVYYVKATSANNTPLSVSTSTSFQSYVNYQFSINYKRTFGKHDVGGLLFAQREQRIQPGDRLPFNLISFAGRITYGYDNRYFAEFDAGYNGSEQFAKGHRFGFFPAISAAWLASNESFLKNNPVLTILKLRASYGEVGNDQLGSRRFLYLDDIRIAGGGYSSNLGDGGYVQESALGNPDLRWEIAKKLNVGADLEFFHSLGFTVDIFRERRDNMLINRGTVPVLFGFPGSLPPVNLGEMKNHGYELQLDFHRTFGQNINIIAKLNYNHAKNLVEFMDEPKLSSDYAYRYRQTGFSYGQPFGYIVDGYWSSKDEIQNSGLTFVGPQPRPGDFKYRDLNHDGIIDQRDMAPIGYPNVPENTFGAAFSISYKGFDFSVLFQGQSKESLFLRGWGVFENNNNITVYRKRMLEAWTPERAKAGLPIKFPALTTTTSYSEAFPNSFWLEDLSFIRLKNAEIGYTLPYRISKKIGSDRIRFYINGLNLLTWDKMKDKDFDPEQIEFSGLTYPIEKVFNFGLNVQF